MTEEKLHKRLGASIRSEEERDFERRLIALGAGKLSDEESRQLEVDLERQGLADLFEACQPLDEEFYGELEDLLPQVHPRSTQSQDPNSSSQRTGGFDLRSAKSAWIELVRSTSPMLKIAGLIVAFAAVSILWQQFGTTDLLALPAYDVSAEIGNRNRSFGLRDGELKGTGGVPAEMVGTISVEMGNHVLLTFRPATAVVGDVQLRAWLVSRGDVPREIFLEPEVSPSGVIQVRLASGEGGHLHEGNVRIGFVISRPRDEQHLPDDLWSSESGSVLAEPRLWRVAYDFDVRPGS